MNAGKEVESVGTVSFPFHDMKDFRFFSSGRMYQFSVSHLGRWIIFTCILGGSPIILRLFAAWMVRSCPELSPGLDTPWFAFSDVAFFGIVFNASAMANTMVERFRPRMSWVILIVVGFSSFLLAVLYMLSTMLPTMPSVLWWFVGLLFIPSIFASCLTIDVHVLDAMENNIEIEEEIRKLPKDIQAGMFQLFEEQFEQHGNEFLETAIEYFRRGGGEIITTMYRVMDDAAELLPEESRTEENVLQAYLDAEVTKGNVPND
jgi:hypothetical protein